MSQRAAVQLFERLGGAMFGNPNVALERDHPILHRFDGARSVHSARRVAQRDACASGKRRNDADGPIWPTEGRPVVPAGQRQASLVVK